MIRSRSSSSRYGFTSASVNFSRENGAGLVGNGCVGDDCSPGTSLCGTGPLFDRPDRLARDAVEHIQQAELRRLRDDVDRLAVRVSPSAASAR